MCTGQSLGWNKQTQASLRQTLQSSHQPGGDCGGDQTYCFDRSVQPAAVTALSSPTASVSDQLPFIGQ